jgi:hypothetical protein
MPSAGMSLKRDYFTLPITRSLSRLELDQFQIMPAPPTAPRPNMLLAEHPFVLDFALEGSADFRISQARYIRRASDLMLVLNLLLRQRISSPTIRGRSHWANSSDHGDTAFSTKSLNTSIGLSQFNVSRGLPFNSAATLSSSS